MSRLATSSSTSITSGCSSSSSLSSTAEISAAADELAPLAWLLGLAGEDKSSAGGSASSFARLAAGGDVGGDGIGTAGCQCLERKVLSGIEMGVALQITQCWRRTIRGEPRRCERWFFRQLSVERGARDSTDVAARTALLGIERCVLDVSELRRAVGGCNVECDVMAAIVAGCTLSLVVATGRVSSVAPPRQWVSQGGNKVACSICPRPLPFFSPFPASCSSSRSQNASRHTQTHQH